ncbi:PAS domain S-box protein [Methanohalophilus halophilus]|uniref:PAS domain S-box protein n=1 Tax=Methanohalophilus halophilus TaxID=2177 RepID=UPI001F4586E8|nr:PAS domain S-box protein [Methanohalophilus halophilus]
MMTKGDGFSRTKSKIEESGGENIDLLKQRILDLEKEVSKKDDLFNKFVENQNEVIFSVNTRGDFTYLNPAIERMTGYKVEEVIGKSYTQYIYPEDLPGLQRDLEKTIQGIHNPYMFRIIDKGGNIKYVHTSSKPIFEKGELVGISGVMVDIQKLKQVEKKLKSEKDKVRQYLDVAGIIILVADRDLKISLANKKASECTGIKKDEINGRNLIETFVPEKEKDHVRQICKNLLDRKINEKHCEFNLLDYRGNLRNYIWNFSYFSDENENIEGIILAGEDITNQKKTEETLIKARLLAESSNRTKSEFIANMSHELRTPLNSVIGFTDVVLTERHGLLNEKQKRYMTNVSKNGHHLLDLINNLLDISRIETCKMEMKVQKVEFVPFMKEIREKIKHMEAKRGAIINFTIENEKDIMYVDTDKIEEIIYNLVDNAFKFTPKGKTITVKSALNPLEL